MGHKGSEVIQILSMTMHPNLCSIWSEFKFIFPFCLQMEKHAWLFFWRIYYLSSIDGLLSVKKKILLKYNFLLYGTPCYLHKFCSSCQLLSWPFILHLAPLTLPREIVHGLCICPSNTVRRMQTQDATVSPSICLLLKIEIYRVEWGYSIILCFSLSITSSHISQQHIPTDIFTPTSKQCGCKCSFKVDSSINRGLERRRPVDSSRQQQGFKLSAGKMIRPPTSQVICLEDNWSLFLPCFTLQLYTLSFEDGVYVYWPMHVSAFCEYVSVCSHAFVSLSQQGYWWG